MEYITAQAGKKMLCREKERVEAIIALTVNRRRSAVFLSGTTAEGSMELPRRRLGKKVFPGRSWSP